MNIRENTMAILHYKPHDYFPVVHFGFWDELLAQWKAEGRIESDLSCYADVQAELEKKFGFDFEWISLYRCARSLRPAFPRKILETYPDGRKKVRNSSGLIEIVRDGTVSIPETVGTSFAGRESFAAYRRTPKLRFARRFDRETGFDHPPPRAVGSGKPYGHHP